MSDTEAETATGWAIELAGATYPLIPSTANLIAIEAATGCTIFSIVTKAQADGMALEDLATIVTGLAAAPEVPHPLFGFARRGMEVGLGRTALKLSSVMEALTEAGVMRATALVMQPLAAFLAGKVTADGAPKAEG